MIPDWTISCTTQLSAPKSEAEDHRDAEEAAAAAFVLAGLEVEREVRHRRPLDDVPTPGRSRCRPAAPA